MRRNAKPRYHFSNKPPIGDGRRRRATPESGTVDQPMAKLFSHGPADTANRCWTFSLVIRVFNVYFIFSLQPPLLTSNRQIVFFFFMYDTNFFLKVFFVCEIKTLLRVIHNKVRTLSYTYTPCLFYYFLFPLNFDNHIHFPAP